MKKVKLVLNTNHDHLVSYTTRTVQRFLKTNGHKPWSFDELVQATAQKILFWPNCTIWTICFLTTVH